MSADPLRSKPQLRWPLDIQQFEAKGYQYLGLHCMLGVAPEAAIVPLELSPVLSRLDGVNTLESILQEGAPHGLTAEMLLKIVGDLDSLGFIDTPETQTRLLQIKEEYHQLPVRDAALAGAVYPRDPGELSSLLSDFISKASATDSIPRGKNIVSLMCPHIDYQRGWESYAATYKILEAMVPPDVIMLIGTAHQASERVFHLTNKDFSCPNGTLPAARELIDELARVYGKSRAFDDEILHREEHSLELQLPFILKRFQGKVVPRVVPILVGSFYQYFTTGKEPIEAAEVGEFVSALAEMLSNLDASGKRVLVYAGVDMAHVGTHFGDISRVSDSGLEELARRDKILIDLLMASDESAVFSHMAEDRDARRVCGYPSLYTSIAAMKLAGWELGGHCLEYRQAIEKSSDCIVTFASGYWEKLN